MVDSLLTTIIGVGDIHIRSILKNVFHVSKFFINLVFMQKLTQDLGCIVTFILLNVFCKTRT